MASRLLTRFDHVVSGVLLRRYKRFLADVRLPDGEVVTAHCPNTGPMFGLLDEPEAPVVLVRSDNPKRKYPLTLVAIHVPHHDTGGPGTWVGVFSARANMFVQLALEQGLLDAELGPIREIRSEIRHGDSRYDFALDHGDGTRTWVEVKSVTLSDYHPENTPPGRHEGRLWDHPPGDPKRRRVEGDRVVPAYHRIALFPDTVSTRAQKHVQGLIDVARRASHKGEGAGAGGGEAGGRGAKRSRTPPPPPSGAAMVLLVQRGDCVAFRPCNRADPTYAQLFREAEAAGVKVVVCAVRWEEDGSVYWEGTLPLLPEEEGQ